MLTTAENQLMTRVGPGTPMGNLLRQYWVPALLSSEIEADGPARKVKLLGEDLVAFRVTSGSVGMVVPHCPHRGASLHFGRNEHEGLTCVYHGWKFDVNGTCVDMPNEPEDSQFKDKVTVASYPCKERNGMIWTYMGPRADPPPLPTFEWNMSPDNPPIIWRNFRACNWMQALEGDIDTSHINYLHRSLNAKDLSTVPGRGMSSAANLQDLARKDGAPRLEIEDMPFGVMYSAMRRMGDGIDYHRIHPFLFPFHTMIGGGLDKNGDLTAFNGKVWVPVDDEHTLVLEYHFRPGKPWTDQERQQMMEARNPWGFEDDRGEPGDGWKSKANAGNQYFWDYEVQREKLYFGVLSNPLQDSAVQESMGAIYDRSNEHLGTADAMIIRVRRRLIEAARALAEDGSIPPGVDEPGVYAIRPVGALLPEGADWLNETMGRRDVLDQIDLAR